MTIQETTAILTLIANIFPKLADGEKQEFADRIKTWHLLLFDVDYALAQMAVIKMLRGDEYPSPGRIIKAVKSIQNARIPSAENAWAEVLLKLDPYRRPEWSHKLIGEAVRCMGYVELCRSENPNIDRAQFLKIYNNLLERHMDREENEVICEIARHTVLRLAKGIG